MRLAHVSDLHIGRDAATDAAARRVAAALMASDAAAVLVTGDVTHRGRTAELARFEALFAPLLASGRAIVVPGNHDRLTEDAGRTLMPHGRVDLTTRPGLHVVRLDSTAPHNRRLLSSHGLLTHEDVAEVEDALEHTPGGALTILMLHHHVHPLPEELVGERLAAWLGWPNAAELRLGWRLLERIRGKCDLVLHGHRHVPSELVLDANGPRPLRVLNAGSTVELGCFRELEWRANRLVAARWRDVRPAAIAAAA